ncbi:MAG: dihydroorotate dehydrogenase [Planctomycetes bacterium]|nr:dihydroorotate dehydrogenase [Planctomycetota bacterium]
MLSTTLGPLSLHNPVLSASGTFGSGWEGRQFSDLGRVGGLVSKTVTCKPRPGNPPPRIVETPSGMLNSIGLENKGVDYFVAETLPRMRQIAADGKAAHGAAPRLVINIGGESIDEFVQLAARFSAEGVDALEVNLSCPNVQEGKLLFSTDPRLTEAAVRAVKKVATVPVFAKLSPNVTDVVSIAKAAEQGGADGVTAINTLIGMKIDWRKGRPVIARGIGGLSGPAIRPVAVRMVYEIARAVRIPILAAGGARSAEDVLEFVCAGASAVEIGTAMFTDPALMVTIVDDLTRLLTAHRTSIAALRGTAQAGQDARAAAPACKPAEATR